MLTLDPPVEPVLDALVTSYSRPGPLNNLKTHTLPNRRAVVEAFRHLQHLIFLGFFSTKELDAGNLRHELAAHLEPATRLLITQAQRACAWRDRGQDAPRCKVWCTDAVHMLLRQLPDLRDALREDVEAAYAKDPAAESIEEVVFSYPGIHALTAYRVAHILYQQHVPLIPRILTEHAHSRTGIDIHPGASIGARMFIDHGAGVVIGATTVIGDDVLLYQGVTLGAHSVDPSVPRGRHEVTQRHPTLGNHVTVYAGATILGGDTVIGDHSLVGGNVWLTGSVPPHSRILFRASERT